MTSAFDSLRSGEWRRVHGGWLAVSVTVAVGLDAVTTYRVLAAPEYVEYNGVVTDVVGGDPLVGAGYLLVQGGALAVAAWLALGWVSTFCATFGVLVHGLFGGISNLLLFAAGEGLYGLLPLAGRTGYLLTDLAAIAVALAVAARVDGRPSAVEAVLVVAAFLGGIAVSAGAG